MTRAPDIDCEGSWSHCSTSCVKVFFVFTAASGRGSRCRAAHGVASHCVAGEGDCLVPTPEPVPEPEPEPPPPPPPPTPTPTPPTPTPTPQPTERPPSTGEQTEPAAGTVRAIIKLDIDIGTIAEGSAERTAFEVSFKTDVALAVGGIDANRVRSSCSSVRGGVHSKAQEASSYPRRILGKNQIRIPYRGLKWPFQRHVAKCSAWARRAGMIS